jgi:chromosome segregation ATPase
MTEFDLAAKELYAGNPTEFIASRAAKARQAKAAGDPALAERIRGLRKPTAAAAIINDMARDRPDELAALADLGAKLRKAHSSLAGPDIRALTRRRHELVNHALSTAPTMSDAVAREVEATLEAVVADPDAAREATSGRLSAALEPASDDRWLISGTAPAAEKSAPEPAPKSAPKKRPTTRQESAARKRKREQLRAGAAELGKARDEAEKALAEAERIENEAAAKARDLRDRLTEAEEAARDTRNTAESARATLARAGKAAQRAQEKLDSVEKQ